MSILSTFGAFVPSRLIIAIGPFISGIIIFSATKNINILTIIVTIAALSFADLSSSGINSITDLNSDRINHPSRPLVKNIKLKKLIKFEIIGLFLISCLLAYQVNNLLLTIVISRVFFEIIYSYFRFKNLFIINHTLVGITYGAIPLLASWAIVSTEYMDIPSIFYFFILLTITLTPLKDIEDYYGDKKNNIMTLPVIIGLNNSKIIYPLLMVIPSLIFFLDGVRTGNLKLVIPSIIPITYLILFSFFVKKQIDLTKNKLESNKLFTPLATLTGILIEFIYAITLII
jgi:geranylgeranylglycerol-phosphate geranylgeranyltransferase